MKAGDIGDEGFKQGSLERDWDVYGEALSE